MKKRFQCGMSLLLTVLLALSMLSFAPVLAEETEVFPEDSIVSLTNDGLGLNEEEGEQTVPGALNCAEGAPQEESPDTSTAFVPGEEDEVLGAGQEEVRPEGNTSAPSGINDSLNASGDMAAAAASVTLSSSSVTVKKGNTATITASVSGYSGSVYLFYGTNNSSSYTCTWGSWYGSSIPLRIKGNALGSGTVTVYMVAASSGTLLATRSLNIKVVSGDNPSIKVSASTVNLYKGNSQKVTVTCSGYSASYYCSYSISNSSVASASWGSWSGSSIPLTISCKGGGKTTITVSMKSSATGAVLAQNSITVNGVVKSTLSISKSSVSFKVGETQKITATVNNGSGSFSLSYSITSSSYCRCTWDSKWSGNSIGMTLTALNPGTSTVTIKLKDSSGSVMDSKQLSVTVQPKDVKQEVIVTPSSVVLDKGSSSAVKVSWKNVQEESYFQYGTTNTSAYSISWGSLSNNSYPLNITGKSAGSGTINVYLKRKSDNKVLDQKSVSIKVNADKDLTIQDVGYSFSNYSQPNISWDLVRMMYGDNQTARNVYYQDIGNGGCCFGMATSSGLIDAPGSPYVSTFNSSKTKISQLSKTDRSSSLALTVKQFVEAMHITQVSSKMQHNFNNLSGLVTAVKNGKADKKPVVICIWGYYYGSYCGHAVLAYDYKEVSSTQLDILIYDSNYQYSQSNMNTTRLTLKRSSSSGSYNSWSYPLSSDTTWGTGRSGARISHVPYNVYASLWNNRGKLGSGVNHGTNLFATTETDFSVYDFKGNLMVRYEKGELVEKNPSVVEAFNLGVEIGEDPSKKAKMFYAPADMYTVVDGTEDTPMEVMLSDQDLSIRVETEADNFGLCADDRSDAVNAVLKPTEGLSFSIVLGSSREEDPDEIKIEGLGTGELISVQLEYGELSISGADAASLSISNYDDSFSIEALTGEGGSITPAGVTDVNICDNIDYTIQPDEGFAIKTVYVDGEDMGPINSYHFENVTKSHSIYAEFTRDLDTCSVTLADTSYVYDGQEKCPPVTAKSPDGKTLVENVDYEVSYEDNVEIGTAKVHLTALRDSGYNGSLVTTFTIGNATNVINSVTRNNTDNTVSVDFTHDKPAVLVAAAYDADGRMTAVITLKADVSTNQATFTFQGIQLGNMAEVKVMLLGEDLIPLCDYKLAA